MARTETVEVPLGSRTYPVVIGSSMLCTLGKSVRRVTAGRLVGVVSDKTVWSLYGDQCSASLEAAGFRVVPKIIEPGEEHKTLHTVAGILDHFLAAGFDRESLVIGFGGGVAGDVAGFVAAICLRGLPFVQVPTTVVAQVDASVGGKTGVDHPLGKNLIGAFHQPSLVFVDTALLASLSERDLRAGLVEVLKHAVIRDPGLFDLLEASLDAFVAGTASADSWIDLVAANCRIKASVVGQDEKESGLRAILNYGHTAGHAIEKLGAYQRYRHGEAVGFGMMVAGRMACERGLWRSDELFRQRRILRRLLRIPPPTDMAPRDIWNAMKGDKKSLGGVLRFVMPRGIGDATVVSDVTEDEFAAAWAVTVNREEEPHVG
ncbi:MAG TPA: 3-dehydroquinate synthase [Candidatus Latescibacteria bacterium]|nr:3-dehydroquinate synthase [Candidatus Latescibacterota bacterium]